MVEFDYHCDGGVDVDVDPNRSAENIDWRVSLFRILSCCIDALLSTLVSALFNNQGVGVRLRDKDRGTG